MKNIVAAILLCLLSFLTYGQGKYSLQFKDVKLSPSQFIHREFNKAEPIGIMDSVCVFALSSIKFTVRANGKITDIMPSVGCPALVVERLKKAIKASESQWINKKKRNITCILPILILPASECPDERPFLLLQSSAQMFKYSGEYVMFPHPKFYNYNIDMVEGITLAPILLRSGAIN